jgi:hypothetical protein
LFQYNFATHHLCKCIPTAAITVERAVCTNTVLSSEISFVRFCTAEDQEDHHLINNRRKSLKSEGFVIMAKAVL